MALSPNEKLITTKEAGERSGYSSDYLSRLVRSGKISGKKIGHSWLVDKESLERFLSEQGDHKIDRARELAHARAREYRAHRSVVLRVAKVLTDSRPVPRQFIRAVNALRSEALALSVALLVVTFGAFVAQAAPVPQLAEKAATIIANVVSGLDANFGDIPSRITARIDVVGNETRANFARIAITNTDFSARISADIPKDFDISFLHPESDVAQPARRLTFTQETLSPAFAPTDVSDDIQKYS